MPETTPVTAQPLHLVHRVMPSIFLFSGALLAFVAVSSWLILPNLMQMKLPGDVLTADQVVPKRDSLQKQITDLDVKRKDEILNRDALHTFVRDESASRMTLPSLLDAARSIAQSESTQDMTVQISRMTMDGVAHALTVEGEVRSPKPGTLTALASFVDALSALPGVAGVDASPFSRDQLPDGTFRSSFTLTLHAQ